jgi:endonuclease-3
LAAATAVEVTRAHTDRELQARSILAQLNATYGPRPWRSHGPAIDEFIATILSQHTSDVNTARAYAELRTRWTSWDDVIAAPVESVVEAIRSAGLANLKAPRVQAVLAAVRARFGSFDFDHLASLPVPIARRELTAFNGVGPKTASCVLLFSLGLPAVPVDTHVHRVAGRIGLIKPGTSAEDAHEALEALVGPDVDDAYAFHMHLIRLGRETCRARRANCLACPVAALCDFAAENHHVVA